MTLSLRILHLEDSVDDGELIAALLENSGFVCEIERVDSREAFEAGLEHEGIDLILSDFSLPGFDGLSALKMARERRPDVPFLFLSGTLGEETAIEALKSGATDYVLKHRMPRLAPAVRRAISESEERRALRKAEEAMIQSEFKYRQLFECLSEAALLAEKRTGRVIDTNRQAEVLLGRPRAQILGAKIEDLLTPSSREIYHRHIDQPVLESDRIAFEGELFNEAGSVIPVAVSAAPVQLHGRQLVLGLFRDITDRRKADTEIQHLRTALAECLAATAGGAGPSAR